MNQVAFKFPDETEDDQKSAKKDAELEIEVIEDTPPEDRGREPLPEDIKKEVEEDDLEEYSDKVKKRLSQMKKIFHDERRAKEAAEREREEALRFAQTRDAEIKKLREQLTSGQKTYTDDMTKAVMVEIDAAKQQLQGAYEAGDPKLIADAQEKLTDAKIKLKEIEFRRTPLQKEETVVETQQQHQETRQAVDPKAEQWKAKNRWFGVDEEMTSLALGLHQKLVRQGVDPRSDEYYTSLDRAIRKRFPENFEDENPDDQDSQATETSKSRTQKSESRKAATVVAPATRSTAPQKVRLTQTQLALAKKLGLTPEQYAKEVIKLENSNG